MKKLILTSITFVILAGSSLAQSSYYSNVQTGIYTGSEVTYKDSDQSFMIRNLPSAEYIITSDYGLKLKVKYEKSVNGNHYYDIIDDYSDSSVQIEQKVITTPRLSSIGNGIPESDFAIIRIYTSTYSGIFYKLKR